MKDAPKRAYDTATLHSLTQGHGEGGEPEDSWEGLLSISHSYHQIEWSGRSSVSGRFRWHGGAMSDAMCVRAVSRVADARAARGCGCDLIARDAYFNRGAPYVAYILVGLLACGT